MVHSAVAGAGLANPQKEAAKSETHAKNMQAESVAKVAASLDDEALAEAKAKAEARRQEEAEKKAQQELNEFLVKATAEAERRVEEEKEAEIAMHAQQKALAEAEENVKLALEKAAQATSKFKELQSSAAKAREHLGEEG